MRRLTTALGVSAVMVLGALEAHAKMNFYVHGRNSGTPSTTDAANYWGGTSCGASNGATVDGHTWSTSGYCGYAGYYYSSGSYDARSRYIARYNASNAWWSDDATTHAICEVASQINSQSDNDIRVVGHSAGGMVVAAMLTDAMNGWGAACGSGVVTGAANKVTFMVAVASPFRGTKIADAVYGHLNNGGNPLTDWLHNFCGNTIGAIANIFADQASSMTYSLQTGQATLYSHWLNNTGKTVELAIGTSRAGDQSVWLGAAHQCAGMETSSDGLVAPYSGRFCTNTSAGVSGSCSGRTSYFYDGANAAIGHSSNRWGSSATTTNSAGHKHGMADLVFWHGGI